MNAPDPADVPDAEVIELNAWKAKTKPATKQHSPPRLPVHEAFPFEHNDEQRRINAEGIALVRQVLKKATPVATRRPNHAS